METPIPARPERAEISGVPIKENAPVVDVQRFINNTAAGKQTPGWEIFHASVGPEGSRISKYDQSGIVRVIEDFRGMRRLSEHMLGEVPGEERIQSGFSQDYRSFVPDLAIVRDPQDSKASIGNTQLSNEFYGKAHVMFKEHPGYVIEKSVPKPAYTYTSSHESSRPRFSYPEPNVAAGGVFKRAQWKPGELPKVPNFVPGNAPLAPDLAPKPFGPNPTVIDTSSAFPARSWGGSWRRVGEAAAPVARATNNLRPGLDSAAGTIKGAFTGRYEAAKARQAAEDAERARIAKGLADAMASAAGKARDGVKSTFITNNPDFSTEGMMSGLSASLPDGGQWYSTPGDFAGNDNGKIHLGRALVELKNAGRLWKIGSKQMARSNERAAVKIEPHLPSMPNIDVVGNAKTVGKAGVKGVEIAGTVAVAGAVLTGEAGARVVKKGAKTFNAMYENAKAHAAEELIERQKAAQKMADAAGVVAAIPGKAAGELRSGASRVGNAVVGAGKDSLNNVVSGFRTNFVDDNPGSSIKDPWAAIGRTVIQNGGQGFADRKTEDFRLSSAVSGEVIEEETGAHGLARAAVHVGDDRDPDFGLPFWERTAWPGPISPDTDTFVDPRFSVPGTEVYQAAAPVSNGNGNGHEKNGETHSAAALDMQAIFLRNMAHFLYGDQPIDYRGRDMKGRFVRKIDGLNVNSEEGKDYNSLAKAPEPVEA